MRPFHATVFTGAAFVAFVPTCLALPLSITPTFDLTAEEAQARATAAEHTDLVFEGRGDRLAIRYTSTVRIDVDLAPRRRGSGFDPAEMLHATLPPGTHEAVIDLTPTPGWSPFHQEYLVSFFSPAGGEEAEIEDVTFLPWTWGSVLRALSAHLRIREVFQVSTFHALRGYNILGFSVAFLVGALTSIAAVLVFLRRGSQKALLPILMTASIGCLAYSAWFGVDLARFTAENLREWYGEGTYGKAGAALQVAEAVRREERKSMTPLFIEVCHDSTDFYTKMLRYALYPIPVSMKPEDIPRATHVVVAQKLQWSFRDGILTCGNITGPATKLRSFPDGSILFVSVRP